MLDSLFPRSGTTTRILLARESRCSDLLSRHLAPEFDHCRRVKRDHRCLDGLWEQLEGKNAASPQGGYQAGAGTACVGPCQLYGPVIRAG